MYNTGISMTHSEIEFLLNCGITLPEKLANKLNSARIITSRLTENSDWLSGFVVNDIVEILTVSQLDDSETWMVWERNRQELDFIKNFIKSRNIDIGEVRIIITEYSDMDGDENQDITLVIRENIYKRCSIFSSRRGKIVEWGIKYEHQTWKKLGDCDSIELKEN